VIRVLLVEDSAVMRDLLLFTLRQDPLLQVMATATDGEQAVAMAITLRPDIVLMDLHLPKINGIDATRRIMQTAPVPIVVISATADPEDAVFNFEALEAGALSALVKPPSLQHPDYARLAQRIISTLKTMSEVKLVRRWPAKGVPERMFEIPQKKKRGVRIVGVGGSTGAPAAIVEILSSLPRDLSVPVLLVQHIADGFIDSFSKWLSQRTSHRVVIAEHGQTVRPGIIYAAPDARQMGIDANGRISLVNGIAEDGFQPSISYLFRSIAAAYGAAATGVLLTGMGVDGAAGLLKLREAGGVTVAQSQETCVVFGMPGEACRLGACEFVLSPAEIGALIRGLTATSRASDEKSS
jgi:two-component system, chemotaxis family, protein-glutamate methylesterase/glutaminase